MQMMGIYKILVILLSSYLYEGEHIHKVFAILEKLLYI